ELDDTPETYGKRKAACERVLAQNNAPYTCIRPALVYGPYDPTDRLYYWIYQCKKHDAMLLPEGGSRKFSITYVKDLVKLIVASLNEPIESKTYNCISSPIISIKEIVDECVSVFKRSPTLHNVSAAFLKKQGISEWFDMPLWLQNDAFTFSNAAMLNDNGLQPTSLYNGLRETISYYNKKGYSIPSYGIGDNIKLELIKEFLKNE
ncbi:MAG: NAD-dependent epimerase/dehydratase family protein, partial [Bacteroidia bacterium]